MTSLKQELLDSIEKVKTSNDKLNENINKLCEKVGREENVTNSSTIMKVNETESQEELDHTTNTNCTQQKINKDETNISNVLFKY